MSSLIQSLAETLRSLPPQLAVMIIATLPLGELRASLPIGVLAYHMSILSSFFWSVIGNMLPVYLLLVFFQRFVRWIQPRSKLADRFLTWLFKRTRRKLRYQVEKYDYWALAMFVAIPLPMSGAWSGSIAAFVFGLNRKKSFLAIAVGVTIAGLIVAFLTAGTNISLKAIQ